MTLLTRSLLLLICAATVFAQPDPDPFFSKTRIQMCAVQLNCPGCHTIYVHSYQDVCYVGWGWCFFGDPCGGGIITEALCDQYCLP